MNPSKLSSSSRSCESAIPKSSFSSLFGWERWFFRFWLVLTPLLISGYQLLCHSWLSLHFRIRLFNIEFGDFRLGVRFGNFPSSILWLGHPFDLVPFFRANKYDVKAERCSGCSWIFDLATKPRKKAVVVSSVGCRVSDLAEDDGGYYLHLMMSARLPRRSSLLDLGGLLAGFRDVADAGLVLLAGNSDTW